MSIIARMFGRLGAELKKGIIPAINLYERMEDAELMESVSDFEPFITELLKYQRTTNIVYTLVNFKVKNFNSPVCIPEDALPQLKLFTKQCLSARDMAGLHASIHLFWNSFPELTPPYRSVIFTQFVRTLSATTPIGTYQNKEIWKRMVCDMMYYALPYHADSSSISDFLDFHTDNPYSYLPMIKYANFFIQYNREESQAQMDRTLSVKKRNEPDLVKRVVDKIKWKVDNLPEETYYPQEEIFHEKFNKALKECKPTKESFGQVIQWIHHAIIQGHDLNLKKSIIDSLVINAIIYNEDDFLCELFNNFIKVSAERLNSLLISQIIVIISKANTGAGLARAMESLLQKHESLYGADKTHRVGIYKFPGVTTAIVRCYLKEKNFTEAYLVKFM